MNTIPGYETEDEDDGQAFQEGVMLAEEESPEEAERIAKKMREYQHVKELTQQIEEARRDDAPAYAAMAKDRLYAAGRSLFKIKVNLIASYIDTWVAILYARDPDVDAMPAEKVDQRNSEEARLFAKTLEVVVSKQWKKAGFKRRAKKWVRAALTVGIGWIRVAWLERTEQDAIITRQIADLKDNIEQLAAMSRELDASPDEGLQEAYDQQLKALESKVERVVDRGFVVDFIRSEDVTIPQDVDNVPADYLDSPWIDTRTFKTVAQARALFPNLTEEQLAAAANYSRESGPKVDAPATTDTSADAASSFRSAGATGNSSCRFVCIHEMRHRESGVIYTLIEGLPCYAREPMSPRYATTRFYDLFCLAFGETDGLRYPESLNTRSHSLQDEYSRTRSKFSDHRDRVVPMVFFDKRRLGKNVAKAISRAAVGEHVGVETTGNVDMSKLLFVPQYPGIDGSLYVTDPIRSDMEIIWGTQEAVMGPVQTPKTATEAKIQEAGTGARTTSKRDALDDVLTEVAEYSAEIVVQALDAEQVRAIAGKQSLWPSITTAEELDAFVSVQIRAGSSGKPDTMAQIERWGELLPIIQGAIVQIGQLRGSSPAEVADKLEALVEETVDRFGDRIDLARLIPQAPQMGSAMIDPMTGLPAVAGPGGEAMPAMPGPAAPAPAPVPGMSGPVGPANVQPLV